MTRFRSTRRDLLRLAAGAAGTAPFLSRSAGAESPNSRIQLALVGCGSRGRGVMRELLGGGAHLTALCDPDPQQLASARSEAAKHGEAAAKEALAVEDYRRLLEQADKIDAVLIATPDHWHAPLCAAFLKAGKHVYCEKPLTHSIAESRELRALARSSRGVTQMGNQGSASASLRRCQELIQAGALGKIREIWHWGVGVAAKEGSAEGEDPVPEGFNWDLWVGPSALRPYKKGVYHPFRWRDWHDFGNGGLADISCHAMNLPVRALDLGYPERLVPHVRDGKQEPDQPAVEFHFPARGERGPVSLYWQGHGRPPAEKIQPLIDTYAQKKASPPEGLMILGENGSIYTSHWNTNGMIHLKGESRLVDVQHHPATRDIPTTLPRAKGHGQEWLDAIRNGGKTYSDFETGGKLTEIGLAGVLALRAGQALDWDGEKMAARGAPETARLVRREYRTKWLT
jgi:predicted dehydrogenase